MSCRLASSQDIAAVELVEVVGRGGQVRCGLRVPCGVAGLAAANLHLGPTLQPTDPPTHRPTDHATLWTTQGVVFRGLMHGLEVAVKVGGPAEGRDGVTHGSLLTQVVLSCAWGPGSGVGQGVALHVIGPPKRKHHELGS